MRMSSLKCQLLVLLTLVMVLYPPTLGYAIEHKSIKSIKEIRRVYPTEYWMKGLAEDAPLNRLSIPGTHDTMAYQGNWGADLGVLNPVQRFTKTQDWWLEDQLRNGVRYVDIRIDDDMSIHHGPIDLNTTLGGNVIPTLKKFLESNPTETIFARMKIENSSNYTKFEQNIAPIIEANRSLFAQVNSSSTLKDARGKIVVFDNTGEANSFGKRGISYEYWNSWYLSKQDNYDNPSRAEKQEDIQRQFEKSIGEPVTNPRMYVNHISATGKPPIGSTPRDFANDLNPWTKNYIKGLSNPNQLGIVVFDFIEQEHIYLLRESNSKYMAPLWGNVPWSFDAASGTLTFKDGELGLAKSSPWNRTDSYKVDPSAVKKIIFKETVFAPTDSTQLFSAITGSLSNLTSIEGFQKVSTSNVTKMDRFFQNNTTLTSVDMSKLDTGKVTSMNQLFSKSGFTSLDLSSWKTPHLKAIDGAFEQMPQLKSLNISNMTTSQATMKGLFTNDKALENLTLGTGFRDLNGVASLPNIQKTDNYTGNWMTSTGVEGGTSSEFLKNYDGRQPGTYRWQRVLSSAIWAIN